MISPELPTRAQTPVGAGGTQDPSLQPPVQADRHNQTMKQRHSLTWLCLLLACIGTSWFSYQIFFVPQSRTFKPDWQNARWIEAGDTSSDPSPVAYFRRSLQFSVIPDEAYITITAKQIFRLYVNGTYIGSNTQDFVRGETPQTYLFDIDSTLITGKNIVGMRIANLDQSTPQLLANISARWGHQNYNYGTDAVWVATRQAALAHPRMGKTDYGWVKPVFDATSWRNASVSSQPISYPPLTINPQIYQQPMPTSWISAGAGQESYYVRGFSIPAGYENALLRIVATGEADIFINDHLYTRWNGLVNVPQVNVVNYLSSNGQPAPYRNGLMLGIYDITPYLHPGSNTIAVHIVAPGITTAKIGLDTQRSAMSLEILAGSGSTYKNVVSSPTQWHASLKPVTGWTKESDLVFRWSPPELIGRPGSSHTFYLPDSNTPHNVQAIAPVPLGEIIALSIIAALAFWQVLALAILRRFMPSRKAALEMASLVFLPALALETLLVALSRETLLTQPFPYTALWGFILIAIVLLTALFLWFHVRTARNMRRIQRIQTKNVGTGSAQGTIPTAPVRRRVGGEHLSDRGKPCPYGGEDHKGTPLREYAHIFFQKRVVVWLKCNRSILPIFLVAIPMVLYNPAYEPYWQDELSSYYAALHIMTHGIPAFPSGVIYPKGELFSYLLAFVMTIFGTNSPVVTRSISMVLFLTSLPIFYIVGSKLFNRRVAWFATTMLAFSPYAMVWSRQVRMYEQAQFMVIIIVGVLYWAIQKRHTAVVRKVERKAGQARREGSVRTFRGWFKASVNRCKTRPIRIAVLCILIAYFSHEEVFIILPALIICSLVASREGPYNFPSIIKKKHWWIPALIALAIISTQLSLVTLSHPPVFGTDQSRRPQVQLTVDNVPYYFGILFEPQILKDGPTAWTPTRPLLTVDSLLAVLGCVIALRRKDRRACYCTLFLVISTITLVFLFTMQADRYYYPLLPVYYLMTAYGTWTVLHALWIFARLYLTLPRMRPSTKSIEDVVPPVAFRCRYLGEDVTSSVGACPCGRPRELARHPWGSVLEGRPQGHAPTDYDPLLEYRKRQLATLTTNSFRAARALPPLLRAALGGTVALVLASILIVPMLPISNFNLFVSRIFGVQYRRHFADYDNVAQYIHDHMRPGDTIISIAPAVIILYEVGKVDDYFSVDRSLFLFEQNGRLMETTTGSHPLLNEAEFHTVLTEHNRIWLITDNGGYQGGATKDGRFIFPPPDFHLVYEGYGSGIYFRSSNP